MILLGIDPGVNGGFASRNGNGDIFTGPLPDTDGDILQLLNQLFKRLKKEEMGKFIC
jgi:hypothetical protein